MWVHLRRDRDSNPGYLKGTTVFETAPIDHSGISPWSFLIATAKLITFFELTKSHNYLLRTFYLESTAVYRSHGCKKEFPSQQVELAAVTGRYLFRESASEKYEIPDYFSGSANRALNSSTLTVLSSRLTAPWMPS